jgi:mono/diheme cytochrome c family protein
MFRKGGKQMNNKGMIVLCIMAIVALVGWLAALSGREPIEDLTKEIKFLRSENARLEKAARKEPSTVEAVAALTAKCRRMKTCAECHGKNDPVETFCDYGRQALPEAFPWAMAQSGDGSIGNEIEAKVKEYMEAQS